MSQTLLPPAARSWRDIPQEIAPRAMSREGRRRVSARTAKVVAWVTVGIALAWGGYETYSTWQSEPTRVIAPVKGEPVRTIELKTDGVLDQAWVTQTLALPKGVGLMEVNLMALQHRLTASGQAQVAVVARKFPDKLTVALQERTPVARIRAEMAEGLQTTFLVARDGVVYVGRNYAEALLTSLPHLSGVRLVREGAGFQPIAGMTTVADLLGTAMTNAPSLYRQFSVVAMDRFADDGLLVVRSNELGEVVFGLRDDFFRQIAFLDSIVEETRFRPDGARLAFVNLAVGRDANDRYQVPVRYRKPEAPDAAGRPQLPAPPAIATPVTTSRPAPRRLEFFPAATSAGPRTASLSRDI